MAKVFKQGDIITADDAKGVYFSSFEGKYIIMDNLDNQGTPHIDAREEIYNSEYVFVTVVVKGTLRIIAGGTELLIKENGYLAIMPCMSIEVKDSDCMYFSFLTKGYLMTDIYEHTKIGDKVSVRAFVYRHHKLTPEITEMLLHNYLHVKREHKRPDYQMKELVLRALQTGYVSHLFSYIDPRSYVSNTKNTRQHIFFTMFLEKLGENHRKERSVQFYANILNITPKYLSTISQTFTGLSASQIIDQYVIYAIKQTLYANHANIKTISSQYNFPSQSFFGRYFKRITGMSPNEYIKNHNRKSLSFENNNQEE
ncbi:MAG: AraC family transcriptional regulator [Prevotellaceae bacterium]|nr:AraC family transcriptional regulator [Candidatus Minthosoma caballi]